MKKILLINAWDKNRGDEALIRAITTLIHSAEPSAEVDVMPLFTRKLDYQIEGLRELTGRAGIAYGSRLVGMIWNCFGRIQRIPLLRHLCRVRPLVVSPIVSLYKKAGYPQFKFFKNYDLVLMAPQGQTLSAGQITMPCMLYSLEAAREQDVPYAILGVSVGPFDGLPPRTLERLKKVFASSRKILLRETISLEHMKQTFPGTGDIGTTIDIVVTLADDNLAKHLKTDVHEYCKHMATGCIGSCISLSRTEASKELSQEQFIHSYIQKMIRFYDEVIGHTGKQLLLFVHIDHDLPVIEKIKAGMRNKHRVVIFDPQLKPSDCAHRYAIRHLDFYISTRYHPTIFSILGEVPFISIIQHFKVKGALEQVGMQGNHCYQDDTAENYTALFQKQWERRAALKEEVRAARLEAIRHATLYGSTMSALLKD